MAKGKTDYRQQIGGITMYSIFITKKCKTSVVIFDIMEKEIFPIIKAFELLRKSDNEPFKREDYKIIIRRDDHTPEINNRPTLVIKK